MKNIIKIIIGIIIIIAIVIMVLFLLKNKESDYIGDAGEFEIYENTPIQEVKEIDQYYTVQDIAIAYATAVLEGEKSELYNILDPKFVNEYNVNEDNVYEKINFIKNNSISLDEEQGQEPIDDGNTTEQGYYRFMIDKIYMSSYGDILTFFVKGKEINTSTGDIDKTSFIVEWQLSNNFYYILPNQYLKDHGYENIELGESYTTHLDEIKDTSYNECNTYDEIDEYQLILDHMSKFSDDIVYDIDNSYNYFEKEYKEKRFNTLEKYKEYLKKNYISIYRSSIEKYKINYYEGYTEYIFVDQYGMYYIFKDTGVMNFTVQLDTYTFDSEEFTERYNDGKEQFKVGLNIERIKEALNRKDYEYVYSKLDETFKRNNFDTLDQFEKYIEENLYDVNKFTYTFFEDRMGLYIYDIVISDATEEVEDSKEKNIVMRLNEGTDFTFSFNVQ